MRGDRASTYTLKYALAGSGVRFGASTFVLKQVRKQYQCKVNLYNYIRQADDRQTEQASAQNTAEKPETTNVTHESPRCAGLHLMCRGASTYAAPSGGGELRRLETPPLLTAQPSRRQRVHHSSTAAPQRLQPHCRVQGAAAAGPHGARKPRRAGNIIYIMHMQPPRARPRGRDGLELTSRRHLHSQRRRVKWAAWEAARSSTRGSGWAPSGPASPLGAPSQPGLSGAP